MQRCADVVVTSFGTVTLSKKTLKWLDSLDPDWREISASKRRGKHAIYVISRVREMEIAVRVAAEIMWHSGKVMGRY